MRWSAGYDDDDELANLPEEAYSWDGYAIEIANHWFRWADKDDQLIAMRAWFHSRYCDPAFETPYNGREGGYIFIHGGPYHPSDAIRERFERYARDDAIEEIIDELLMQVGDQWAPIRHSIEDEYDEDFGVEVSAEDEPLHRLDQRMADISALLSLEGSVEAMNLARRMAFSAAIAALESYLWETMVYWVEKSDVTVRNIIEKIPAFKDRQIKMGDIFAVHENLRQNIKLHMQNMVWHQWKHVVPLFEFGLSIEKPNVGQFEDAVLKRHDIVHRSGYTKSGELLSIEEEEIKVLCSKISAFANQTNMAIFARPLDLITSSKDAI